jgi:hypothetical protein
MVPVCELSGARASDWDTPHTSTEATRYASHHIHRWRQHGTQSGRRTDQQRHRGLGHRHRRTPPRSAPGTRTRLWRDHFRRRHEGRGWRRNRGPGGQAPGVAGGMRRPGRNHCPGQAAGGVHRRRHPHRPARALAWRHPGDRSLHAQHAFADRRRRHGAVRQCASQRQAEAAGRGSAGNCRPHRLDRGRGADRHRDRHLRFRTGVLFPHGRGSGGRRRGAWAAP